MPLPPIGEPAPDFILPGPDGKIIHLADYQGRFNVVLAFYPFDFSPICSMQLPGLQDQIQRFIDLQTVVLGISTDSPHSHRAFSAELGLEFPLLSDFFGHSVSEAYGVLRPEGFCERATFVVDKNGLIRYAVVHEISQVPDIEPVIAILATLNGESHD